MSEVIGFVLSFALSAVFLMISLSAFHTARNNSDAVITAAELKTIADRVAGRIVEAGMLSQEFPNATMNITIDIPQNLNGHPYEISATDSAVTVTSEEAGLSATSTTFRLEAIDEVEVTGKVLSANERLVVTYSRQTSGTSTILSIHIHEEY